jgi:hypothetical protein
VLPLDRSAIKAMPDQPAANQAHARPASQPRAAANGSARRSFGGGRGRRW